MRKSGPLLLESLTWPEAEKAFKSRKLVVFPIGARLKEHGPHLPLNNDFRLAEALTARVFRRTKTRAVFAPTIPYGYYPAFVDYPGSTHLQRETFQNTIKDLARSFARHGITRCYFLNTGVSTNWALEPARLQLASEGIWIDYTQFLDALSPLEAMILEQPRGSHADEAETSMMLELAPKTVQMARARPDLHVRTGPGPFRRKRSQRGLYSPSGVWGDPTLATKAKGRALVNALVEQILKDLKALSSPSFQPAPPRPLFLE